MAISDTPRPARDDAEAVSAALEGRSPQQILAWALDTYRPRITLACSFGGPSGMVLLDMVMALDPSVPVFYLDTGLLFPETHALIERVVDRYHPVLHALRPAHSLDEQAAEHGDALWSRDPDRCCALRKVAPQRSYLAGYDAWITGLRRDQASTRRATPILGWDAGGGLAKVSPLVTWDERQVWSYLMANDVPYNPLHDRGYPSIGCTVCTRPVVAGADPRSGRWSGFDKTECGLHMATTATEDLNTGVHAS